MVGCENSATGLSRDCEEIVKIFWECVWEFGGYWWEYCGNLYGITVFYNCSSFVKCYRVFTRNGESLHRDLNL